MKRRLARRVLPFATVVLGLILLGSRRAKRHLEMVGTPDRPLVSLVRDTSRSSAAVSTVAAPLAEDEKPDTIGVDVRLEFPVEADSLHTPLTESGLQPVAEPDLELPAAASSSAPRSVPGRIRSVVQIVLFTLVMALLSWRTIGLLSQQVSVVDLPGVVVGAPAALLLVLFVNRLPLRARLTFDPETDVIVAIMFAALGLWLLYWTPRKLGPEFWLWRSDLFGLAFAGVALASVSGGTGFALLMAPSIVVASVVMSPVLGLITSQAVHGSVTIGTVSGILAVAPLLISRPFSLTHPALRLLAAIVGGAVGSVVAVKAGLTSADVTYVAAACALVAVEGSIVYSWRRRETAPLVLAPPKRFRWIVTLALAVSFAALDGLVPAWASVHPSATKYLIQNGATDLGGFSLPGGAATHAWLLTPATSAAERVEMVITTTGKTPASVLTYPVEGTITWPGDQCAVAAKYSVEGRTVTASEFASSGVGYRWNLYSWDWRGDGEYQRVVLIIAYGPKGDVLPMPSTAPRPAKNALGTVALFLANRHVECGSLAISRVEDLRTVTHLMADER